MPEPNLTERGAEVVRSRNEAPGRPVVGLDAIGKLFGRTRWTIRRWIDEEDFPAAWLPNGQWCTSTTLIDQWLLDRAEAQRGE